MIDARKIWSSTQLPTSPAVAVRLLELSRQGDAEIRDFIAVIKSDAAISAKILKATNSTFFGFSSKVTSIDRAVPLLGTTMVTSLALTFSIVPANATKGPLAEHYQQYWLQSIVHGAAADTVARKCLQAKDGDFFLGGLLMDLGRLAMLKAIPDDYAPALEKWAQQPELALAKVEQQVLGTNHCEIGSKLMKNWGLADSFQMVAKRHHNDLEELFTKIDDRDKPVLQTCAMAAAIGDYFCTSATGRALERLRDMSRDFFGLSEYALQTLLIEIKARVDATGEMFAVNTSKVPDPADLMAQACEQLSQLAMREHVATTQAVARQKVAEDQQRDLELRNAELRRQTLHDPLTKVYNRAYFDEILKKEVQRCCRTAEPMGLIFADVDHFKMCNDTHGHQFGDLVLQRVANCMRDCIRGSDTLARYGGEEFVLLITQPTEKGIEKVAERLRSRIASEMIHVADREVRVTASFGAALTVPGRYEYDAGTKLLAAADEAMYLAKQAGRNRVEMRLVLNDADRKLLQLTL